VNSFLCLEYEKEVTLCGCNANCNAEEGQERKIIEKSNCSSAIARDFTHCKRFRSVTRENQRRTRDREPSRIPVRKVLKVLKTDKISQTKKSNYSEK